MIKLFLCGMLCTFTTLTSLELHRRRTFFAEVSKNLADKSGEIIALLRYESADVFEICATVFRDGFADCDYKAFSVITSGDFPTLWKNACKTLPTDKRSAAIFSRIGKILGSCDSESQVELISSVKSELSAHAAKLCKQADDSKKLYTTLGALLGAAISIMMI